MITRATIVVVDDDPDVLTAARLLLTQHFERVLTTEDPNEIESLMTRYQVDAFLVDMNFAIGRNTGSEGLKWLDRILCIDPDAVVVLMTAFGDLNTAVQAMRDGAADFILKPWQNDKLVATLNVATKLRQSRARVHALGMLPPSDDLIAVSPQMQNVLTLVKRVAATDVNVLIRGENGTGKELVAQLIHRQSERSDNVMVAIDLGAVAESLFESELFGHRKGAFTDATSDRAGRFQAADRGTLFLDEIGNLPLASQSKLLRVLESREVLPLGSDQAVPIDVRLVAASNQPLEQLVSDGLFREDLLYRINTIEITLPPLRDRIDDIEALVRHFITIYSRKYRLAEKEITAGSMAALRAYHWPGNVRELSHAVERALILSDRDRLHTADFRLSAGPTADGSQSLNLETSERNLVSKALEVSGGNISRAADLLGLTRAALYRRIEKFQL